jgi:signal transduction histidine kinase/sugar lactone lactonase YvrE
MSVTKHNSGISGNFIFVLAFLSIGLKLCGQVTFVQHLSDKSGLPQNTIKGLALDQLGYLWIGTETGICRYDGRQIKSYDLPQLGSHRVGQLIQDKTSGIIYAFFENRIISISHGRILSDSARYPAFNYSMISSHSYVDAGKRIHFVGLAYNHLSIIDGCEGSLDHYPASTGNIIAPLGGQLHYIDQEFNTRPATTTDRGSSPWMGISSFYSPGTTNSDSHVLIVRDKRLYSLRMVNGKKEVNVLVDKLPFDEMLCQALYIPSQRLLCLGTISDGLYIFKTGNTFSLLEGTRNKSFTSYVLLGNSVFFDGDIIRPDGVTTLDRTMPIKISPYLSLKDHHGDILFHNSVRGIIRMSPSREFRSDIYFPGLHEVNGISEDKSHRIWISDNRKGLFICDNSKAGTLTVIRHAKEITKLRGIVVEDEKRKAFWVIKGDNSIFKFDAQLRLVDSFTIRTKAFIRSLFLADNGMIWVTTYGKGIYKFTGDRFIPVPADQQNYLQYAHCIMEDRNNNFWISTNKGLFRVSEEDLNKDPRHAPQPGYYYYNYTDGIITNEFNGGCYPCGSRDDDGAFTFPTMKGIIKFHPENTYIHNVSNPVFIDDIVADESHIRVSDTIHLKNNIHRLTFSISIPYWGNSENLHMSYHMEGSDKYWSNFSGDKTIQYTDLPSGIHKLEFRVKDLVDDELYHYTTLYIEVDKKFYETWWFLVLVFLFLGLVATMVSGIRNYHLKKRNRELETAVHERSQELLETNQKLEHNNELLEKKTVSLNQSILQKARAMSVFSHNIIGPIKYISVVTEAMGEDSRPNKRYLNDIHITSKSLLLQSVELLNWLNIQDGQYKIQLKPCNIHDLTEEKCTLFAPLADYRNTRIINSIRANVFYMMDLHLFGVIIYNLLDNAIKYSLNGTIHITSIEDDSQWSLIIEDTGRGMSPEQVEKFRESQDSSPGVKSPGDESYGLGWSIISDCLKFLNAGYTLESFVGKGTKVTVMFPKTTENAKPA